MNTKVLMGASALFMLLLGAGATFLPQEILVHQGADAAGIPVLAVQAAGALYLGFAMLNWGARGNVIGGIYSRPVAAGNFMHFTVLAVALLKELMQGRTSPVLLAVTVTYVLFALGFGFVLFTRPRRSK